LDQESGWSKECTRVWIDRVRDGAVLWSWWRRRHYDELRLGGNDVHGQGEAVEATTLDVDGVAVSCTRMLGGWWLRLIQIGPKGIDLAELGPN
jgi:hypothetical protein